MGSGAPRATRARPSRERTVTCRQSSTWGALAPRVICTPSARRSCTRSRARTRPSTTATRVASRCRTTSHARSSSGQSSTIACRTRSRAGRSQPRSSARSSCRMGARRRCPRSGRRISSTSALPRAILRGHTVTSTRCSCLTSSLKLARARCCILRARAPIRARGPSRSLSCSRCLPSAPGQRSPWRWPGVETRSKRASSRMAPSSSVRSRRSPREKMWR